MKRSIAIAAAAAALAGCQPQTGDTASKANHSNRLVLYYSQTGVTAQVAQELAKATGADIERIEALTPYDGTYEQTIERGRKERESGQMPAINPVQADIAAYDTIFLGYPVWFGTYANPVATVLQVKSFEGKTVVPFCTFGSGGLQASAANIQAAQPKANVVAGYGVREARIEKAAAELDRFLKENGHLAGAVEPLPPYGESAPVGEAEVAIFDAACGDYPHPLGRPIEVAYRETPDATHYRYSVDGGTRKPWIIYVEAPADGSRPMFTQVLR